MDSLLTEVDVLLTKINSLPQNEKELALKKIRDQLASNSGQTTEDRPAAAVESETGVATAAGEAPSESKNCDQNVIESEVSVEVQEDTTPDTQSDNFELEILQNEDPDLQDTVAFVVPYLQCDVCGICLKDKASLQKHLSSHKNESAIECDICHQTFKKRSSLKVHQKRHNNKRDYPCSKCDYKSFTKIELDRHFSSAHKKTYENICEYCGRTFSAKRLLNSHIRAVHEKPRASFQCANCPYSARVKGNLRVHMQLKHFGDYYTHVCPVCGARVTLKSAFLEHLRAHTGERPFKCDLCTSSFACQGRLNAHKRTIHNPRQFDCNLCEKKFPTKHSLERHTNSHLNSKPHACPFCQFACNMLGNLTKHIRNRHNMPDFSMRDYKKQQNGVVSKEKKKWTQKGEMELGNYLTGLSQKLGREVTVDELRSQEEDKRKHLSAVVEKAKLDRINKITTKEHSYVQKPAPPAVASLPHVLPNIYAEAIAAANLDFSTAELPNLLSDTGEGFCVDASGLILPADLNELRDPMLPNFTDMLSLGIENYQLPVMEAPNCFVQLPTGEKVQFSLQDQQLGSIELPVLSQPEIVMPDEFLPTHNTYMIVLADSSCEVRPHDPVQL